MPPSVYHGSQTYPGDAGPIVTIGNFDGVHRGHRSLLAHTRALAKRLNAPSCVYTFDPVPRDVLRPGNDVPRIQSLADRIDHLGRHGIDHVVVEAFSLDYARQSPQTYVDDILVDRLGVRGLVLGWDFRFGAKRAGTIDDLRVWLDLPVEQVPALEDEDGEVISSSRIRKLVRTGDVASAAVLLDRPHEVVGTVIHGDARGRTIGFPTANLDTETALIPGDGVYAVRVDGRAGVANVGERPTVNGGFSVEVHLLDFSGDLYGERLRIQWIDRLRGEQRFDSVEALKEQIARDVEAARAIL